eukprot:1158137-Pelagomonas_calceolata.AAC.12
MDCSRKQQHDRSNHAYIHVHVICIYVINPWGSHVRHQDLADPVCLHGKQTDARWGLWQQQERPNAIDVIPGRI